MSLITPEELFHREDSVSKRRGSGDIQCKAQSAGESLIAQHAARLKQAHRGLALPSYSEAVMFEHLYPLLARQGLDADVDLLRHRCLYLVPHTVWNLVGQKADFVNGVSAVGDKKPTSFCDNARFL